MADVIAAVTEVSVVKQDISTLTVEVLVAGPQGPMNAILGEGIFAGKTYQAIVVDDGYGNPTFSLREL